MTRLHKAALSGLLWLAFSAIASATSITVAEQNFNVNGGGAFSAYLNGNSGQTFEVYCVDYRNTISPPDTFDVNIDRLSTGIGDTRYGTTPESGFSFQIAPVGMTYGDAVNRYLLAAWLTTQYDMNAGANTGDRDLGIQSAIWNILDTNNSNYVTGDVVTWENNAVLWEQTQTQAQLLAFMAGVTIYTSVDVAGNHDLNNNDTNNRYSIGPQEIIATTPEPGMLVLVGGGLAFLGLLRRRIAK